VDVFGQMHLFVKVIESGGFTAAGKQLGLPKSTVSRQVAALENRLGVRLLHRTTRVLRPTEAGLAYYEQCTRILTEVVEAETALTRSQMVPTGKIRVTAPLSFGYRFMGEMVASFLTTHPQVELALTLSDRRMDLIEDGYDVAIRVGVLDDSSLVARRLGPASMVIVGSPDYFQRSGVPELPSDLKTHACLLYAYGPPSWSFRGGVTVPVSGPLASNNGDILAAAAAAGLGLVLSPRFIVADELASGELVSVLEEHLPLAGGVWALYPANRFLSAKVRAFVDHVVGWFAGTPSWEEPTAPR
jgi:DNA-binding transcriptional LysR family regulator